MVQVASVPVGGIFACASRLAGHFLGREFHAESLAGQSFADGSGVGRSDSGVVPLPSTLRPVTQNRDWRVYDWAKRHAEICELVRSRKPELVFIGDSITHFFGGEPRARIVNGGATWQKPHPTDAGYAILAEAIEPAQARFLGEAPR
ncbi:MAG: hypothetical protein WCO84_09610 [bacterium]